MSRSRSVRSGFEQRFLRRMRLLGFDSPSRITIGFSGGYDSLALALALRAVSAPLDLKLLLVHVDHRLRPESGDDARKCAQLAEVIGIPIEIATVQSGLRDKYEGLGIEEAARRERYLTLARIAQESNSLIIALGHQIDDQAETVLLHLVRGSGLRGLGGMRERETRSIPWWDEPGVASPQLEIVRPLLRETRQAIEAYVDSYDIKPVHDHTNDERLYDRNWVRHEVLPRIAQRWPAARSTIGRAAFLLDQDAEFLDRQAETAIEDVVTQDRTLCTDKVGSLHPAISSRVIRHWLELLGVQEIDQELVERVAAFASSGEETRVIEIGNGVSITGSDGQLISIEQLKRTAIDRMPMDIGPETAGWRVQILAKQTGVHGIVPVPSGVPLTLRTLRPGDRWYGTQRSIAEDLRAHDIHPLLREHLLAMVTDDGVLLIPAIYPTIHSHVNGVNAERVGVRWTRVRESGKTEGSSGS